MMGRERELLFAKQWERIANVRSRFRRGVHWLKFGVGCNGDPVVAATESLDFNHEILNVILNTVGLDKVAVSMLEKEAWLCIPMLCLSHIGCAVLKCFPS